MPFSICKFARFRLHLRRHTACFPRTNSAAQDRNTEQHAANVPSANDSHLFQALSPEKPYATPGMHEPFDSHHTPSVPRSSMHEKSTLREAFQRIKIAGDFHDMSHIEDLEDAVGPLLRAMVIREKCVGDGR